MAFCMWKIHSGISKPAKYIIPNCTISRNVLRDVPEVSESFRWVTYSALLSRPVLGHCNKTNHCSGQLKRCAYETPEGCSANNHLQAKPQLQSTNKENDPICKLSVNLSDLYTRDPLAILLHSRLQIYNDGYPNQRQDETIETKGHTRALRHDEPSVLHSNTLSSCLPLRGPLADQRISSASSATSSFSHVSSETTFPAYRETVATSYTLGSVSVIPPSSTCYTLQGDRPPLCRDQTLASSSVNQYSSPVSQPSNDQCGGPASGAGGGAGGKLDPHGLPTPKQLRRVHDELVESLTNFFVRPVNYSIYDPNIIFENRIRGTVTKGLSMYALQLSLLNTVAHLKHAHVRFDIIKITQHPEEATIKVRWRIKGVKSRQAIFGFLKARKWSISSVMEQGDSKNWYDGFSTFHVNSNGLVARHVADNMMPDDEKLSSRQKTGLVSRLALLFGLLPKAGHGNAMLGGQLSNAI